MTELHPLIARQLRRAGIAPDEPPRGEQWHALLEALGRHYRHVEEDRALLTRSLDLSSQEMAAMQERMRRERDRLQIIVSAIAQALNGLHQIAEATPSTEVDAVAVANLTRADVKRHLTQQFDAAFGGRDVDATGEQTASIRDELVYLADKVYELFTEIAQRAIMQKDMEVARTVQSLLVPQDDLFERPYAQIAGYFRPAGLCSGDWWSVHELAEERILVIIGDVTGHGIAPAIITGVAKAACDMARLMTKHTISSADLLSIMNLCVAEAARQQLLMTCAVATLDPNRHTMVIANAGHPPPLLVRERAGGLQIERIHEPGDPLGSSPRSTYAGKEVRLEPGDLVVYYTDGVVECEGRTGKPFGEARLREILTSVAREDAGAVRNAISREISSYLDGLPPRDDMTFVVIKIRG